MQTINLSSINMNFLESFTGSFSTIQKCEYDGQVYVYKKFDNINFFKKNMKKFQKLNEIDNDYLVMPAYFVFDDYEQVCNAYLTRFIKYKTSSVIMTLDDKVERLNTIKNNIKKMHDLGIIHGDLHFGNILLDENSYQNKIIDFDNCSYKNYKINKKYVADYTNVYINKYGINKGLDIFLFNLITYSVLNVSPYYQSRLRINNEIYGIFDTNDGRKVCNDLLLQNKTFSNEYLIDTCLHLIKK